MVCLKEVLKVIVVNLKEVFKVIVVCLKEVLKISVVCQGHCLIKTRRCRCLDFIYYLNVLVFFNMILLTFLVSTKSMYFYVNRIMVVILRHLCFLY